MPKRRTRRQILNAREQRRAHIKRGMKIMLYEINQRLAAQGAALIPSPGFFDYTVAIAEGGRQSAEPAERIEAIARQMFPNGVVIVL